MSIQLDEGALTKRSTEGPPLYIASAMPQDPPKAVLAMVPGYADHGARYAHVMGALAEHGIGSVVVDLRGHGRAGGPRGYCARFAEYLDDVRELRRDVSARVKTGDKSNVPRFLFGHSFGGLVAAASVLDDPDDWKGLVLSDPFFGLGMELPRLKLLAGRVASKVYPRLALPTGIAGSALTHDAAKAKGYESDPLVFKKATARWFTEATAAQARTIATAPRMSAPLYVVFGMADVVASPAAGKRFFDAAGSADKTWDPREGLFHEVLNEPSWKEIVDPIAKWILARV